ITSFIHTILRYGRDGPGLFGSCTGYYGMVEAQGRGTLHCHFVVWLKGHLSPQSMVERLAVDGEYKCALTSWLEDVIKCELPDDDVIVPKSVHKPVSDGTIDPRTREIPNTSAMDDVTFVAHFNEEVTDLAMRCNWHVHNSTCWKYLRPNDKRVDENCRMRMTGETREETIVDRNGAISLRRLHPWIANYNDVCLYLFRCNMDIKMIGSGQAAKALMYYITDYVTKSALPLYEGLAALSHAITVLGLSDGDPAQDKIAKVRLVSVVNSMMSRHEMSHPQVMADLLGNGDRYASGTFRPLYWGSFDRFVAFHMRENDGSWNEPRLTPLCTCDDEVGREHESVGEERSEDFDDSAYLSFSGESITASNQLQDYTLRPIEPFCDEVSLWTFVSDMDKVPLSVERTRLASLEGRT
ncbi:hypothetical protein CALVIDRAFT_455100, partial [Calocera viscosa TUFC12733]